MDRFINELFKYDDVYIVFVRQVLEWMENLILINELDKLSMWICLNL